MKTTDLTQDECIAIARDHGLGPVQFVEKVPINTTSGKTMTVGYVGDHLGHNALFCKRHSWCTTYILCNEYRDLARS